MSSLYDRMSGVEGVEKIAVWPLINDLYFLEDGDIDLGTVAARHSLSTEETTELGAYLAAVQTQMATVAATEGAVVARLWAFRLIWHVFVGIERGVLTEAQALAKLGVE